MASKTVNSVTITLTVYLSGWDYGSQEKMRGRVTSEATQTIYKMRAGGCLLWGGWPDQGGQQLECRDTGYLYNTNRADTGWTSYYTRPENCWIMTGHSYFQVAPGQPEDYLWADNTYQC